MDSNELLGIFVWDSINTIIERALNPKEGTPPTSLECCLDVDDDTQEVLDVIWNNSKTA